MGICTLSLLGLLSIGFMAGASNLPYVPDNEDLFSINPGSTYNVNSVMDSNFVKGGKLFTGESPYWVDGLEVRHYTDNYVGKEPTAVANSGSLSDYESNPANRKLLANRLIEMLTYDINVEKGLIHDSNGNIVKYTDISDDKINDYIKDREERIALLQKNDLTAVKSELVRLIKDADMTIWGGGWKSYWAAQRQLRVFCGVKDYKNDATDIPAWDKEFKNNYWTPYYALTVGKDGKSFDNGKNMFVINFSDFINQCDSQKDLYYDNLNRLFDFIYRNVNNGNIDGTKGKSYVLCTKPDNPVKVSDLSNLKETLHRSLTENENNWYGAIGDAYGGISAKVTFTDKNKYDVEVNYYIQDEYLWGRNYDRKANMSDVTSEGGMSILAAAGKVTTDNSSYSYFKPNTTYYPQEYKIVGVYKRTFTDRGLGNRYTTTRTEANKAKGIDIDSDTFNVYFENESNKLLSGRSYTVTTGKTVSKPSASEVSKSGYELVGWKDKLSDKEFSVNNNITVTRDMILVPVYKKLYTVRFVDGNGNTLSTQQVREGEKVKTYTGPTPSEEGGTFTGWDSNYNKTITSDTIIRPNFMINQYTVTFKNWEGKVISTSKISYEYNAIAPASSLLAREGYTFTGWDKSYTNIKSDLVVTAQYTKNKYTVEFRGYKNGVANSLLATQTVEYGSAATAPTVPTDSAYSFTGWDKSFNNIKANTVVNASYEKKKYTVEFRGYKNGISDSLLSSQTVEYGSAATAPTVLADSAYTFLKWDKSYNSITSATTINGIYQKNEFTVKFIDYDGTILGSSVVKYGEAAQAPYKTPSREGYTFDGWDKSLYKITSNTEIQPIYKIATNKVTFKDNVTGKTILVQYIDYNKSANPPVAPTILGYTFTGWEGNYYNVTKEQVIVAKYEKNKYTVTFKDMDGYTIKKEKVMYGEDASEPEVPAVNGYDFDEWDNSFSNIQNDIVVQAKYTKKKYQVIFRYSNGEIISKQSVYYGESAKEPDAPEETGKTFGGWDKSFDYITKDTDITAVSEGTVFTVTFKNKSGEVISSQNVSYGQSAEAPEPLVEEGFTFSKWNKTFDKVKCNMEVEPIYIANRYNVTFFDEAGNELEVQNVSYGENAVEPEAPVINGKVFDRWDTDFSSVKTDLLVKPIYKDAESTEENNQHLDDIKVPGDDSRIPDVGDDSRIPDTSLEDSNKDETPVSPVKAGDSNVLGLGMIGTMMIGLLGIKALKKYN